MNSLNNNLINNKKLVFSARKCYTYNPAFNLFPLISFEEKRWYYRKKKRTKQNICSQQKLDFKEQI